MDVYLKCVVNKCSEHCDNKGQTFLYSRYTSVLLFLFISSSQKPFSLESDHS